jgi:iron complex transport system ATP-binding protein
MINSGNKIAEGSPKEVLTEELIKRVFGIDVVKVNINEHNIICPLI